MTDISHQLAILIHNIKPKTFFFQLSPPDILITCCIIGILRKSEYLLNFHFRCGCLSINAKGIRYQNFIRKLYIVERVTHLMYIKLNQTQD
jgi:hypothetical protein